MHEAAAWNWQAVYNSGQGEEREGGCQSLGDGENDKKWHMSKVCACLLP